MNGVKSKDNNIVETFESILDGLMLGDGCLFRQHEKGRVLYCQTCKHRPYLIQLMKHLEEYGLSCAPKNPYISGERSTVKYHLRSRVHDKLEKEKQRWYKGKKKIVPEDLVLTPDIVRHWYIGDGCLCYGPNTAGRINFATHCFSEQECLFLIECFWKIGFKANYQKNGSMEIKRAYLSDFLDFTYSETIPPCFHYKWCRGDKSEYHQLKDQCSCYIRKDNQQLIL